MDTSGHAEQESAASINSRRFGERLFFNCDLVLRTRSRAPISGAEQTKAHSATDQP